MNMHYGDILLLHLWDAWVYQFKQWGLDVTLRRVLTCAFDRHLLTLRLRLTATLMLVSAGLYIGSTGLLFSCRCDHMLDSPTVNQLKSTVPETTTRVDTTTLRDDTSVQFDPAILFSWIQRRRRGWNLRSNGPVAWRPRLLANRAFRSVRPRQQLLLSS